MAQILSNTVFRVSYTGTKSSIYHQNRWKKEEIVNCYEEANHLQQDILHVSNNEVFSFISGELDLTNNPQKTLLCTRDQAFADDVDFNDLRAIINLKRINHTRDVNEHFRALNRLLPENGVFIGKAETYFERKKKFLRNYGSFFGMAVYLSDFLINRAFARMYLTEGIYSLLTRRRFHELSYAELLGRLVFCGFSIRNTVTIDGMVYFSAKKTSQPSQKSPPSHHLLMTLPRIGKCGKIIKVYKFRTMHPYSEFLQDYMIKRNGYNSLGKPNNDWRITRWGKWMRKLWLDELPQIINVLKGEMGIVGVRPISKFRFSEFPDCAKNLRILEKPGCIPPYVSLNMPDKDGNIEAEIIYLHEKEKKKIALATDARYFFKAVYNVFTNKIRSA